MFLNGVELVSSKRKLFYRLLQKCFKSPFHRQQSDCKVVVKVVTVGQVGLAKFADFFLGLHHYDESVVVRTIFEKRGRLGEYLLFDLLVI